MSEEKQELRYGENVECFLNELAAYEPGDLSDGSFDVYGEDEQGREGSCEVDIPYLAADAVQLISELRDQLSQREAQIAALTAENVALKESVDHAAGCIHAAEFEGLADALSSTTDSRLADLVHRRLCHAYLAVKTPSTDAAANALRAEGAIAARNALVAAENGADIYATVTAVIDQLREGKA